MTHDTGPNPPERTVVFVCLHGAAKSVLAAADFERLAAERGLRLRATFVGVEPGAEIAAGVVDALRAEGVDLRGQRPRLVTRRELETAWRVVSFGCDLEGVAPPEVVVERWDEVPAVSDDFGAARRAIGARLERLLGASEPAPA
ncbi:MAG: hypothetical protein HY727_06935 [Candidatus Rokubacteria bacterium]|nr:hypothetical protein [Candidatus Rokubacteria bacterium]